MISAKKNNKKKKKKYSCHSMTWASPQVKNTRRSMSVASEFSPRLIPCVVSSSLLHNFTFPPFFIAESRRRRLCVDFDPLPTRAFCYRSIALSTTKPDLVHTHAKAAAAFPSSSSSSSSFSSSSFQALLCPPSQSESIGTSSVRIKSLYSSVSGCLIQCYFSSALSNCFLRLASHRITLSEKKEEEAEEASCCYACQKLD